MNADAEKAIRAQLSIAKDNLYRAKLAARRSDVRVQWGDSDQTLQQIIDGYQAEVDRWNRTLLSQ